ncbi:MAG: anti-sigma factor [Sporichthyaceae bacterium]
MSDLHILAGAYAAGALDADEQTEFELHLGSCSHCDVEVRELLETTALLGIATAEAAPPSLRAAVMTEVARTRQLPPVVVALSEQAGKRRGLGRRFGLTAAASLAVFTVGLGAYTSQLADENGELRKHNEQIAALLAAPDARTISAAGAGASGSTTVSAASNRMDFVSSGLATRPGKTYQLWLIDAKGNPRSVGTFTPRDGKHTPVLFNGPGDATKLAVTEEPKGGSLTPTMPILMSMDLKKA